MSIKISFGSHEEWLAIRKKYIGGSEIASLFNFFLDNDENPVFKSLFEEVDEKELNFVSCISNFKTGVTLWHERKKNVAEQVVDNDRVIAGQFLEDGIARWAGYKLGKEVKKAEYYLEHETVKGMGASLDYEILNYFDDKNKDDLAILEIKNVDWKIFNDKWVQEDGSIEPPISIQLQVQHQIACSEAKIAIVAACVGGNKLELFEIERNDAIIKTLETTVTRFWQTLEQNIEPDIKYDYSIAFKLFNTSKEKSKIDLSENEDFNKIVDDWIESKEIKNKEDKREKLLRGEMLSIIKENELITVEKGLLKATTVKSAKGDYRKFSFKPTK